MTIKHAGITLLFCWVVSSGLQAQTYDFLWKQVEQAEQADKPQTVVELTDMIYKKAEVEKNVSQMLKAYTERLYYRSTLDPKQLYPGVEGLKKWAETTDNPLDRAVLHSLIAGMYANYAMDHRYNLPSHIDVDDDDPIVPVEAWSSSMLVRHILKHTREALRDKELLLKTSTQAYAPFIVRGETSRYYQHDLYHLLGRRAIEAAKGAIWFGDPQKIAAKEILELYQSMLDTYQTRGNEEATISLSLDFLDWRKYRGEFVIRDYSKRPPFGQNRYVLELDRLIERYRSNPVTAEIYLNKAQYAVIQENRLLAMQFCEEAIALYPKYERINALKELREEILSPTLRIGHGKIFYPESEMRLSVDHRNLDGFQVTYYRVNMPEAPTTEPEINEAFYRTYTTKLSTQHFSLKRPSDYMRKDTVFALATPGEGMYVMRFVPDGKAAPIVESLVYVTRLMVLTRPLPREQFEMMVLDRKSGHPVPEAQVVVCSKDYDAEQTFIVDSNGKSRMPDRKEVLLVRAWKGTDRFMPSEKARERYARSSDDKSGEPRENITLLTDRSLYRSGQTVYVKGIAAMQQLDTAQVVAHKDYVITLNDDTRHEIARKEVTTNELGSFTTDFVLPAGVNGLYNLKVLKETIRIRVEDYKRPQYDIQFDKPTGTYSLGDSIQLSGRVRLFNGAAVQGVPVQYTIGCSVIMNDGYPRMWHEVLLSGTTELSDEGVFSIPVVFTEKGQQGCMYYDFRVDVKVTSISGETQLASFNLGVGKRSLILSTDLPSELCKDRPVLATFRAVNLSAQLQEVEGTYQLYPVIDKKKKQISKEAICTGTFISNRKIVLPDWQSLPSGYYQLAYSASDAQGREVANEKMVTLYSEWDTRPLGEVGLKHYPIQTDFDANHPAVFTLATPFTDAYLMMSVAVPDSLVYEETFVLTDSTLRFEIPYREVYGDAASVQFTLVKDGRLDSEYVELHKRVSDKKLNLQWAVFRDKLRPGQQEEWKLTVKTPQGIPADAEMLTLMYDASLDNIESRNQKWDLYYSRSEASVSWDSFYPRSRYLTCNFPYSTWKIPEWKFDRFSVREQKKDFSESLRARGVSKVRETDEAHVLYSMDSYAKTMESEAHREGNGSSELRTNFSETVFFLPQLRTNKQGEVSFAFTMPEALTRWKFQGYAHTREMLTGILEDNATTSKEFMLMPNMPRFVRVGDEATIMSSIVNLTGKAMDGTVVFTLFDPVTEKVINTQKQSFTANAGKTISVSFRFAVTDEHSLLGCRVVADGGTFSDGEQHLLPVLSNKERLTEAVALPVRGNETRTFPLATLFNNQSRTAENRRLTVEFTTNPAWYAIQVLPSLNVTETRNTLSCVMAYYANELASHIMNSQPRIQAMIDGWKMQNGTKEALLSNLQKNQEVKNILLTESPWVMEAKNEEEQMQRISTLFDLNTMGGQRLMALQRLKKLQLPDGLFPWFEGMGGSNWVTLYVVELCTRLSELTGRPLDKELAELNSKAMNNLFKQVWKEYYEFIKLEKAGKTVPRISGQIVNYLYVLALADRKVDGTGLLKYLLNNAARNMNRLSMEEKAKMALVFSKAGRQPQVDALLASLREYLFRNEERGAYFAFKENAYTWNGQLIPAHVRVMEAFDRVANDTHIVEEMKLWLLKQKQMQQWNSPVATADAVYALLCRGASPITGEGSARIAWAGRTMDTEKNAFPGLGVVRESFTDKKTVEAKEITVTNRQPGSGWGAVYAQYEEAIDRVQQQGGELSVDKQLYIEQGTGYERRLQPVTPQTVLKVGDKVVSRITIQTDRPMEFIQLKDQRGACFEPSETLSGYRWTNGFGYYVDVKDASTSFFFDGLGKGTFVLEYAYYVARPGTYNAGLATIQCAYAPEYASHSASMIVVAE